MERLGWPKTHTAQGCAVLRAARDALWKRCGFCEDSLSLIQGCVVPCTRDALRKNSVKIHRMQG